MTDTLGVELKITRLPSYRGSGQRRWSIDREGVPYGQIWTFRNTKIEKHPFHLLTLSGFYQTFSSFKEAEHFVVHLAG